MIRTEARPVGSVGDWGSWRLSIFFLLRRQSMTFVVCNLKLTCIQRYSKPSSVGRNLVEQSCTTMEVDVFGRWTEESRILQRCQRARHIF